MYHDIVVLGVIVALIYIELTGLSPAGLVVPGYMTLCLKTPERIAYTLLVALIAWGLVKVADSFIILYGRRRFAVMIVASFAIGGLLGRLLPFDPGVIGVLVPGIMASEFEKQGIGKSLLSLCIVMSILALLMMATGRPVFAV